MALALVLVALILSVIGLIQSKGTSIVAWAIFCLALSQSLPVFRF
jgi:hypothetical protein